MVRRSRCCKNPTDGSSDWFNFKQPDGRDIAGNDCVWGGGGRSSSSLYLTVLSKVVYIYVTMKDIVMDTCYG